MRGWPLPIVLLLLVLLLVLLTMPSAAAQDTTPATFCIFGYEGKAKIVCKEVGEGPAYKAVDSMDEAEVRRRPDAPRPNRRRHCSAALAPADGARSSLARPRARAFSPRR